MKVKDVTIHVQGVASDRDPVLYDICYLVQYLRDIKAKFIPLANCRSHKQNGNNQQVYFRCFQVTQNQIRMLVSQMLIIIALIRNNGHMNFIQHRRNFCFKKRLNLRSFHLASYFLQAKAMQNNFRKFEELVFLISGFQIPGFTAAMQ